MITSTGTVITMTDKLKEAAEQHSMLPHKIIRVEGTRTTQIFGNSTAMDSFLCGAEWARAEVLEMLRSDEAEEKPKPFKWNFVIEKTYDTGKGWADWLEKRWREEGHFDELG